MNSKVTRYKKINVELLDEWRWHIIIDSKIIECTGKMNTEIERFGNWDGSEWGGWDEGLETDQWVHNPPDNLIKPLKKAGIQITKNLLIRLYPLINHYEWYTTKILELEKMSDKNQPYIKKIIQYH